MEGIRITQKENGETLWTLYARRADFLERGDKAELADMSMVMPQNNIALYAKRGVYSLSSKRFTTDSPVKARAKDFLITADSIDYDVSTGNIESDGRVELVSEKMRIEGRGLKTAAGLTVTIYDDVKATFYQ
jgi:lipopolysaccharide assembly outer membrane protein LptD (OstA)